MNVIKAKVKDAISDSFKGDTKGQSNPWVADRGSVLAESRSFHQSPIDATKCMKIITKIMFLLNKGEQLSGPEQTDLFFGITKLFQGTNNKLRRMVYLMLRNLNPSETEVFIVTSSLTKDMQSTNDCYRANAIRALSRVMDAGMASQMDRFFRAAIVDRSAYVASSALISGLRLMGINPDLVRRWSSEVTEAVNNKSPAVQFHALALLYELKKSDRLSHHKVIAGLVSNQNHSRGTLAECLLIRHVQATILTDREPTIERVLLHYLEVSLRSRHEAVAFEAARALVTLGVEESKAFSRSNPSINSSPLLLGYHDLSGAVTVLQILLSSARTVSRFAAVRVLAMLAQARPNLVTRCASDLEPLLSDSASRSVGVLALTTLLRVCQEQNVEKLVKQMSLFMSEVSESFRLEVVYAVRNLMGSYPKKLPVLLAFVASNLREDGSPVFKRSLVDCLMMAPEISSNDPVVIDNVLNHLCEYIEDCEDPTLCCDILRWLGITITKTAEPWKFVRFIYNRLILETAVIRSTTVGVLIDLATLNPTKSLNDDIKTLLQSVRDDPDDVVREQIAEFLDDTQSTRSTSSSPSNGLPFSIEALYFALEGHLTENPNDEFQRFDELPSDAEWAAIQNNKRDISRDQEVAKDVSVLSGLVSGPVTTVVVQSTQQIMSEISSVLSAVMDVAELGTLLHSTPVVNLTEEESEYPTALTKHIFAEHLVLEFAITNTVKGQTLENVGVKLGGADPELWFEVASIGIPKILENSVLGSSEKTSAFVVMQRRHFITPGNFSASLKFQVKEGGANYADEYQVDNFKITYGDYFSPEISGNFKSDWENMESGEFAESVQKYQFAYKSLAAAVVGISRSLNLSACEGTNAVPNDIGGRTWTLLLSGKLGNSNILVRCLLGADNGRTLAKVTARSKDTTTYFQGLIGEFKVVDWVQKALEF